MPSDAHEPADARPLEFPEWGDNSFWSPYPPEVAPADRQLCSVPTCGLPGELVYHDPGQTGLGGTMQRHGDLIVFCEPHARENGYQPEAQAHPAQHLNAFQRMVVHVLGHGDPGVIGLPNS